MNFLINPYVFAAANGLLNGLEYYYKFAGDMTDEIASADGTNNGATYDSGGTPEGAYDYDGVNDYATFPHSSITTTNNFTINFWYTYLGGNLLYFKAFRGDLTGGAYSGFHFYHTGTETWFRKANSTTTLQDTKFTDTTLNNLGTHMVTVEQSSTTGVKVYIDNSLVKTESGFTANLLTSGSNTSVIGANFDEPSTANNFSNVSIGGDAFYNRILTADDRAALYNSGAGLAFSEFTT